MRKLPDKVICDHCGYISDYETMRLKNVGDESAWLCPACELCNTSYHLEIRFRTELGYQRDLEVEFL